MDVTATASATRFAIALFASFAVHGTFAADWDRLEIPPWGESLTINGEEVPDAVIDPADIERFVTTFQSGDHFEAYAIVRDRFLINGLIPETSRTLLRSILGEPAPSWEKVHPSRHSVRLGKGPGSADVRLMIDWRVGIVVDTIGGSTRRTEKRPLGVALGHLRNWMRAAGDDPDEFYLEARRFGEDSIILTSQRINPLINPVPDPIRYYVSAWMAQPRINSLDTSTVASIVADEVEAADREGSLTAAKTFLHLLDPIAVKIDSSRDIPSHNRSPLDADIRSAVRPPFEHVDRRRNSVVLIFYAYRHVEGVVTRNRLEFREGRLSQADVQVVGKMIGNPTIYF